jgi:transcriptional regulator with XRE-family HTH domain
MLQLGTKIKNLRENANLTQKDLADYLSVDQSLISKFEKGERSISSDMLEKLAILFCCPLSTLMSNEQTIPAYNIAFRTDNIKKEDLSVLSVINKIALNQAQMDKLARGNVDDK